MIIKLSIQVLRRSSLTGFNRSIVAQKFEAWREESEIYCFPLRYDTCKTTVEEVLAKHEPFLEGYYGAGDWEIGNVADVDDSLRTDCHSQDAFFVIN